MGFGEAGHSETSISLISTPNGLYCIANLNGEDLDKLKGYISALSAIGRLSGNVPSGIRIKVFSHCSYREECGRKRGGW